MGACLSSQELLDVLQEAILRLSAVTTLQDLRTAVKDAVTLSLPAVVSRLSASFYVSTVVIRMITVPYTHILHTCIHTYIYIRIYVYTYNICMYVCMYVRMYVCMYVCVCVCVYYI